MRGLKTALELHEQLEDAQTFRMERETIDSKRKSIEARCERHSICLAANGKN